MFEFRIIAKLIKAQVHTNNWMWRKEMTVFLYFWILVQNLDEIQSYILVERSVEQEYGTTDSVAQEFIDVVSSLWVSASNENSQSSVLYIISGFVGWIDSCEVIYELQFTSFLK